MSAEYHNFGEGGHWITINGAHVLIKGDAQGGVKEKHKPHNKVSVSEHKTGPAHAAQFMKERMALRRGDLKNMQDYSPSGSTIEPDRKRS